MNHPAPAVSVVMPTFDKASYLERTLASWTHQTASGYELVIADDGSTDDTPAVVARYASRLPIVYQRIAHAGRAAARNHALDRARGEIVVFSDDDMVVSPGYIEAYRQGLAAGANLVALGWMQRIVVELRPHEPIAAANLLRILEARPELREAIARNQPSATISAGEIERDLRSIEPFVTDEPRFIRYAMAAIAMFGEDISRCALAWGFATTGNMAIRRDLLDRVGGFDPNFAGWGLEDTELHYRMTRAGAATRYIRDAVSYHQNHPRDEAALIHSWWRNLRYLVRKHPAVELSMYPRFITDELTLGEAEELLREHRERPTHPEPPRPGEYDVLHDQLRE